MNGSEPGKNFCGNTVAAATPYRKKSVPLDRGADRGGDDGAKPVPAECSVLPVASVAVSVTRAIVFGFARGAAHS